MGTSIRGRDPAAEEEFLGALYKGGELLAAGKVVEARSHLEKAQSMQPKHEKALNLLGLTYFKLGLFDRAADVYEVLVRENPADPTLRVNLGLVYLKTNDVQRSVKEFETATDLEPEHKKAHNYLGLALAQAGEYSKAREHFRLAGSDSMADKMARAMITHAENAPQEPGLVVPSPPPPTAEAIPVQAAPAEPAPEAAAVPPPPPPPDEAAAEPPEVEDGDIEVMSDDEVPSDEVPEQVGVEIAPPTPSSPINSDWGSQFGIDKPPTESELRMAADEGPVVEASVEEASADGAAQWTEPMPTPAPQPWSEPVHAAPAEQGWGEQPAPEAAQSWGDQPAPEAEQGWGEQPAVNGEPAWGDSAAEAQPADAQPADPPWNSGEAGPSDEQSWAYHSSPTGHQWQVSPDEQLQQLQQPEWITQPAEGEPAVAQPAWIEPSPPPSELPAEPIDEELEAEASFDASEAMTPSEGTAEAEWVARPLDQVGQPVPTAEVLAAPSPPHVDISLTAPSAEAATSTAAGATEAEAAVRAGYTAMGAQKLIELGQNTRWMTEAPPGPFNIGPEGLALTVRGELLTRLTGLVAIVGTVDARPEHRRVRGKGTDQPFGAPPAQLQRVTGAGVLYLEPGRSTFHAVDLDDEGAYLREERVFAFEEAVSFENGRLTGEGGVALDLVHLKGNGKVLMQLEGPLKAMPLPAGMPMVVPLSRVVGWFGRVSPRLVGFAGQSAVELTGEGYALLGASERS